MKQMLLLLCTAFLWSGLLMAEEDFFPYPHQTVKLDNGFKAILIPMKGSGLVAYYTMVRTGSRDEYEPGKSGFAHFFEHMMFRGTEKFPADVYNDMVNEMGVDANAYTTDDYTCYTSVVSTDNLEKVMELESDRFQNLSYQKAPFQTEAGAVYGEYRKNVVNPWAVAHEAMMDMAFDKHTYQHTTMGFEADIKMMPEQYEYSLSFFQRYYRPDNCVLLLAGDFDSAAAQKMIQKYYGEWKPGYQAPPVAAEPAQNGERVKAIDYDGQTLPLVWVSYKGKAYNAADKMVVAAFLLGDLAFGENSEIYKKLVIEESKVQFIGADFGFNRDPKLYDIYSMVRSESDIDYVIEQIDATAAKFREELVSAEALENLKKRNRYGYLMDLDTPGSVADALARFIALTGNIDTVNQLYKTMQQITPEDVREAARTFLVKERRNIIKLKGVQS
ncbi:MAG TPA: pitrilysin family protein [Calditrichia bacterium]|nr:pitrilysin family protein [Calditrichia bacterium]